MDRIEQLMKNAKPNVPEPGTTPGVLPGRSHVFSDDPNLVSLAGRTSRRTGWAATAGVVLAAAAVVGAVVVADNLVPQSAPAPATTDTPSITATPTPTASPTVTPSATASPTPTTTPTETPVWTPSPTSTTVITPPPPPATVPPTTAPAGPAAGACTPDSIDIRRNDQVRAIKPIPANEQQYYTVLGCAEGWLAYAISDEGIRAIGLDGGNAWYRIARLQGNGRYLDEYGQVYSSVHNWEFHSLALQNDPNNKFTTAQQSMDHEFETNGIPVRLRTQLVGPGPAAPTGTSTQ
ncbi:hypothetical protein [Paenarthrobacter sp. JL.01a]|uniref:hypothetical protein n=1 Tax=Paenarthrobacter sp. JL.01a TaxID=2979324 RepID=UPI0021C5C7D2|nr:hypothetical protein [Paenarthrobacter sp. JL.01a]UXM90798.1 hypothetical protein N5P29_16085 [Paenarthrobacter sp. JL.01a]